MDNVTIYAVGDILPQNKGEFLLAHTASILKQADITFCQLEIPFSSRVLRSEARPNRVPSGPGDVAALVKAGFKVCSLLPKSVTHASVTHYKKS